jgi:hypothetical protein
MRWSVSLVMGMVRARKNKAAATSPLPLKSVDADI